MARKNEETRAIDKIVGERINMLRITNGLSRQQLAAKIDVTHQQLQKYEKGTNRVSCGRIAAIAKALKQPISYFFDEEGYVPTSHQRMCIEVSRNFLKIESYTHQTAVNNLINSLANK